MKNITLTLDPQIATWLRVSAAAQGKSVSRFVGEVLESRRRELHDYDESLRRFRKRRPFGFEFVDGRHPARDELHDRAGLR